jgi:hypothetical protein
MASRVSHRQKVGALADQLGCDRLRVPRENTLTGSSSARQIHGGR